MLQDRRRSEACTSLLLYGYRNDDLRRDGKQESGEEKDCGDAGRHDLAEREVAEVTLCANSFHAFPVYGDRIDEIVVLETVQAFRREGRKYKHCHQDGQCLTYTVCTEFSHF